LIRNLDVHRMPFVDNHKYVAEKVFKLTSRWLTKECSIDFIAESAAELVRRKYRSDSAAFIAFISRLRVPT